MCKVDSIALKVSGVTKRFVKSDGFHWPWKRNGNSRKPVVAVDCVGFQVRRKEIIFQPMEEMSRGMQQKVAIARAFLTQPITIFCQRNNGG